MRQTIVFVLAVFLFGGGIARASVDPASSSPEAIGSTSVAVLAPQPISPRPASPRPASLIPLYTTFAALQALDADSTMKAIRSGAGREANPVLRGMVGSPAGLLAVKAGTTAAIILASERLRRGHHSVAAVVMMVGVNSAFAMVAAHNYSVVRGR
jgi:hypothetical protein